MRVHEGPGRPDGPDRPAGEQHDRDHAEPEDDLDCGLEHDRPRDRRHRRARHPAANDTEPERLTHPGREDGIGTDRTGKGTERRSEPDAADRVGMAYDSVPRTGLGGHFAEVQHDRNRERTQRGASEGMRRASAECEKRVHGSIVEPCT